MSGIRRGTIVGLMMAMASGLQHLFGAGGKDLGDRSKFEGNPGGLPKFLTKPHGGGNSKSSRGWRRWAPRILRPDPDSFHTLHARLATGGRHPQSYLSKAGARLAANGTRNRMPKL